MRRLNIVLLLGVLCFTSFVFSFFFSVTPLIPYLDLYVCVEHPFLAEHTSCVTDSPITDRFVTMLVALLVQIGVAFVLTSRFSRVYRWFDTRAMCISLLVFLAVAVPVFYKVSADIRWLYYPQPSPCGSCVWEERTQYCAHGFFKLGGMVCTDPSLYYDECPDMAIEDFYPPERESMLRNRFRWYKCGTFFAKRYLSSRPLEY